MRTIKTAASFIITCMLCFSCNKVEEIKQELLPIQLKTTAVSTVSHDAVTLHGYITSLNSETIVDVGFLIYEGYEAQFNQNQPIEISIGSTGVEEGEVIFTYRPDKSFKPDGIYSYCFYIKTESSYYKGEFAIFKIDDLHIVEKEMEKAALGDSIYIEGDFDRITEDFVITIQGKIVPHALSNDKKQLTVILPEQGYLHGDELVVEMQYGLNQSYVSRRALGQLKIVATIDEPTKYAYNLYEQIRLSGKGLPRYYADDLYLIIGDERLTYSEYHFLAQLSTIAASYRWGYYNGKDSVFFKSPLTLQPPTNDAGQFSRSVLHPGETGYLDNLDLYNLFNNKITSLSLGNQAVTRLLPEASTIFFSTTGITDGTYPLTIHSPYYNYNTSAKVEVRTLRSTGAEVTDIYYNNVVKLSGTFAKDHGYNLEFQGEQNYSFYYTASADGELKFPTPFVKPGTYSIKIGYGIDFESTMFYVDNGNDLTVLEPVIEEIFPTSGYPGDIITVRGKGLKQLKQFLIDGQVSYAIHQGNGDVKFFIPTFAKSGNFAIAGDFENFMITSTLSLLIK